MPENDAPKSFDEPTPEELTAQMNRGAEVGATLVGKTLDEATEAAQEEGFIIAVEEMNGERTKEFADQPIPVPEPGRIRLRMKDGKVDGFTSG
jgi:hypothetical protein